MVKLKQSRQSTELSDSAQCAKRLLVVMFPNGSTNGKILFPLNIDTAL